MPPKAVPEAKPKAGVTRPRSAIGESEEVRASAKKRQSGADRSPEFDVEKALKDNFQGFSVFQLRMIFDDEGNSVEDRVRQRKQLNDEEKHIHVARFFTRSSRKSVLQRLGTFQFSLQSLVQTHRMM